MRDSGAGDNSSRGKRPRKTTARTADDVTPKRDADSVAGEGLSASTGKKKTSARGAKKSTAADVASTTTAASGASKAAPANATRVTPGDGQSHHPTEFKAVAPFADARTEEIPVVVAREDVTVTQDGDDVEIRIRRRAYEIYLSRRGAPGDPMADWIAAEREVRSGPR